MRRRYRPAKKCIISPWLSARIDCSEGRFIQVGNSLLLAHIDKKTEEDTNPFHKLSSKTQMLYLCMTLEAGGSRNFEFPLKAAKKYGIAESTFRRGVTELVSKGFITRQSGKIVRLPNLYQFSEKWKEDNKSA